MAIVITNDSLIKDKALNTVKQYEDDIMSTGNSIINSSLASIQANEELVNSAIAKNTEDVNRINTLNKDLLGKAQFTADQRKLAGVDTELANLDKFGQELNTINANIKGLSREAQAIPIQLQEEFKNTGATDRGVAPIQTGRLRENAIKALTQASLADIAVANIKNAEIRYNTALEKANLAVDLKYKPIETEIAQLKEQLALNKEFILDPAEKRLMANQTKILNERERLLTLEKEKEKTINEIKVQIAKTGGNPTIVDKAKTVSEAINLASSSLREKNYETVKMSDTLAYVIDKNTGKVVNTLGGGGTSGTGGTGTGGITTSGGLQISKEAQNILSIMNTKGGTVDDYIKGTSKEAQRLRNEVFAGLASQGGNLNVTLDLYKEAKTVLESAIKNKDWKEFGYSARLGGKFLESYADMSLRANQISAILAKDNLGLLKGAMSDNDLRFIQAMSGGIPIEGTISEKYAKERYESIYNKLNEKLGVLEGAKQSSTPTFGKSDTQAIQDSLKSSGQDYPTWVNNTPKGHIPVIDRETGRAGYVPIGEYSPNLYIKG